MRSLVAPLPLREAGHCQAASVSRIVSPTRISSHWHCQWYFSWKLFLYTSELPKPSCLRSRDWRNVETLDRESSHAKKIIRCPVMFRTESPKTLLLQKQTCQIGIWGKYPPPALEYNLLITWNCERLTPGWSIKPLTLKETKFNTPLIFPRSVTQFTFFKDQWVNFKI